MFFRLPLLLICLLICLLSLALGPVPLSAACRLPVAESSCSACCSETEKACCTAADAGAPVKSPAVVPTQVDDGKLLASPLFLVVAICPLPALERPAYFQRQSVGLPVTPRLDVTCIRLI